MNIRTILIPLSFAAVLTIPAWAPAEESLSDMYQRKGVKEFVARQYDQAINDLEQARTADPANTKTTKLLAKCWERKGASLLESGDIEAAARSFSMALEVDATNEDARKGLSRVDASRAASASRTSAVSSQTVPQAYVPPPAAAPAPTSVVISPQVFGGDSQQSKVVAGLFNNFQLQQQMMAQQLSASNDLMKQTDKQKDMYLAALIQSSEQKSSMMRDFIVVGALVVVIVIIVALLIFVFIFSKFAKASELRTIQATEALQAVLASQPLAIAQQEQKQQLLIGGPAATEGGATAPGASTSHPEAAAAQEALVGVSLEELSSLDPSQRAKAVELFESELADGGARNPALATKVEKLKELLDDTNNRVRANAAKAYYYVDSAISIKIFSDMLAGDSSRLRASALWALGEIGTAETLSLILEKDNESDEIVRYNIRMALDKVRSRNRFPLSDETRTRLESLIERYADAV